MSRENIMIKGVNGEEFWISRSVVVVALVLRADEEGKVSILVEKRGPAVSATGRWCIPCGYLDYDENLNEAVVREVREETGYYITPNQVSFVDIESEPVGNKQNVVIRHIVVLDSNARQIEGFQLDTNEVTELKWAEIGEMKLDGTMVVYMNKLESIGRWAFNHKNDIKTLLCKKFEVVVLK